MKFFMKIFIFMLIPWKCSASNTKAHHIMTKEDLRRIFQVEHLQDVPEYEIVRIHSVRHKKRSVHNDQTEPVHRVQFETHGRLLKLELTPNRFILRPNRSPNIWYADFDEDSIHPEKGNVSYSIGPEDTEPIGEAYQDEENQAAMLLYKDTTDDALLMDGTIGDELVVKPLPAHVRSQISQQSPPVMWFKEPGYDLNEEQDTSNRFTNETDDYEFLDENLEDADVMVRNQNSLNGRKRSHSRQKREIRSNYHIVFKRKNPFDYSNDFNYMELDQYPQRRSEKGFYFKSSDEKNTSSSRSKRQAPYMIFPEILCIIDYDGYRLHGKDNIAIKRYVISFWNGIDLRYKLLTNPSVKISIAGIIISRGRDATPYLERNRVGQDALDSASALTDMGKYLFLERRLPVYDIAVAITKLDMCRRKSRYGECNRGTAGFAYVGGACVVNKRLEKVNSVAIVEDTGGFSGIIVAAHELGHLLGAVHDGSPPPSYLGGPGAGKCRWEDGFIMSDLRHTSKGFRWSSCTIKQFKHFLNGETATCMYNSPHETESLPRVLPGKLLTLDAQCRKDRGTSACFKDGRVCAQLFCFDAGSGYCVSYRPAAEGSRCGDRQICLNGKCVSENENTVDYYENAYARRMGEIYDADDYDPSFSAESRRWWNESDPTNDKSKEVRSWPSKSTAYPSLNTTTPSISTTRQNLISTSNISRTGTIFRS